MARRKSSNQLLAQFNRLVTNPAISEQRYRRVMLAYNAYTNNIGNYFTSRRIYGTGGIQLPRNVYMGINAG